MSDPLSVDDGVDYNYDDIDYGGSYDTLEDRIRDVRASDRDVKAAVKVDRRMVEMIKMIKNSISSGGTSMADVTRAAGIDGLQIVRNSVDSDYISNHTDFSSKFAYLIDVCNGFTPVEQHVLNSMPNSNYSFESHFDTHNLKRITIYWRDSIHSEIEDDYCSNLGMTKSDMRRLVIMCGLTKSKMISKEGQTYRDAMITLGNFKEEIERVVVKQEELFVYFLKNNRGAWLSKGMKDVSKELIEQMIDLMATENKDGARTEYENIQAEMDFIREGTNGVPRY